MKRLYILLFVTFCLQESEVVAKDCISNIHDFQQSLVNRSVNLDSLNNAFSPPNHQGSISLVVHYYFCSHNLSANSTTSSILCSDLENWANDLNSGQNPEVDFKEKYDYKFLWNASPINLFIRPQLLSSLSLYTFRIHEPHTYIILDQVCDTLNWPANQSTTQSASEDQDYTNGSNHIPLDDCNTPSPVLILLEALTADLRSFNLHKQSFFTHGIKADGNEHGYPTYFYDPNNHITDVCVLRQVQNYVVYRYLLGSAILLTQLLIPFVIPFSGRLFYSQIEKRMENRKSDFKHYLRGFIFTLAIVCVLAFGGNLFAVLSEEWNDVSKSNMSDVHMYYIYGLVILVGVNPINAFFNIWYNSSRLYGRCCIGHHFFKRCKCQCMCWCSCRLKSGNDCFIIASICIVILSANLLSFNLVYVFMGLIAAPIETGSLVVLYLTMFFLLMMFFTLMSKGFSAARRIIKQREVKRSHHRSRGGVESPIEENYVLIVYQQPENQEGLFGVEIIEVQSEQEVPGNKCLYCDMVIGAFIAVLVVVDMMLYLAFYYEMAISVEPYSSSAGFVSSFGSLVPAIFTLTAGLLEKRLINFLRSFEDEEEERSGRNTSENARGGIGDWGGSGTKISRRKQRSKPKGDSEENQSLLPGPFGSTNVSKSDYGTI